MMRPRAFSAAAAVLLLACAAAAQQPQRTVAPHQNWHIFVLGLLFAAADAFGIGSNDVANSFATSVGSGSLTLRRACMIACVTEFTGAFVLGAPRPPAPPARQDTSVRDAAAAASAVADRARVPRGPRRRRDEDDQGQHH